MADQLNFGKLVSRGKKTSKRDVFLGPRRTQVRDLADEARTEARLKVFREFDKPLAVGGEAARCVGVQACHNLNARLRDVDPHGRQRSNEPPKNPEHWVMVIAIDSKRLRQGGAGGVPGFRRRHIARGRHWSRSAGAEVDRNRYLLPADVMVDQFNINGARRNALSVLNPICLLRSACDRSDATDCIMLSDFGKIIFNRSAP
jgi:hypothetical protein